MVKITEWRLELTTPDQCGENPVMDSTQLELVVNKRWISSARLEWAGEGGDTCMKDPVIFNRLTSMMYMYMHDVQCIYMHIHVHVHACVPL